VGSFEKIAGRVQTWEQADYQPYVYMLREARSLPLFLPSLGAFTHSNLRNYFTHVRASGVFEREIVGLKEAKRGHESGKKDKLLVDFAVLRKASLVIQEIQANFSPSFFIPVLF